MGLGGESRAESPSIFAHRRAACRRERVMFLATVNYSRGPCPHLRQNHTLHPRPATASARNTDHQAPKFHQSARWKVLLVNTHLKTVPQIMVGILNPQIMVGILNPQIMVGILNPQNYGGDPDSFNKTNSLRMLGSLKG